LSGKTNHIIRLAILDDHQIVIDGLKLLLSDHKKFLIEAEATTAEEMLQKLRQIKIDVLLTDIAMPDGMNGFDLSLKVKKEFPQIKILALSMSEEGGMIARMMDEAKVDGYIPKTTGQLELLTAIETVAAGEQYFSAAVIKQYESYQKIKKENIGINLTIRELQIIECIIKHYSNKQIADELFISERTVETHRKNIYRKTNTKGEASLIQFVKEHKLIP
jgi:two-component system, NarL family, nitrate/nitrite response regulator NarL